MVHGWRLEDNFWDSVLSYYKTQGSNSGHQTSQQVPLPTETPCWSFKSSFDTYVQMNFEDGLAASRFSSLKTNEQTQASDKRNLARSINYKCSCDLENYF